MSDRAVPGWFFRSMHFVFLLFCVVVAGFCALLGTGLSYMLDWTMLGMAVVCLMPALLILDILTMAILAWSSVHTDALPDRDRTIRLVHLTSLAVVHLAAAGLAIFLLAVPASSIWSSGLTLPRLRSVFLALSSLGLLLSLELPYTIVNCLLPVVRQRQKGARDG